MKAKIKATGEVVQITGNCLIRGGDSYIAVSELEPLEEDSPIDWEQRRYEIAKAAMQGILADSNYEPTEEILCRVCIKIADEMVKQLKKGGGKMRLNKKTKRRIKEQVNRYKAFMELPCSEADALIAEMKAVPKLPPMTKEEEIAYVLKQAGGEDIIEELEKLLEEQDVCHVCGKTNIELIECECCGELYCDDCSSTYNQFTQIDYNCCKPCSERERE